MEVQVGLKLSRLTGESLLIGDDVEVSFYRLKDGQAWVEIHAPKEVLILRSELVGRYRRRAKTEGRWKKLWRRYVRPLQRNR